jgi:AcrR family transcriptional regulator
VPRDVAGGESQGRSEAPSGYARDRERLIAAVGKAAGENGYAALTVEQVIHYADVPRAIFDAHFESKEHGLVAAQDAFLDRLWLDVVNACEEVGEWPLKVRTALGALLASLVEVSSLARVFAVEAVGASLAAAERQFATLDRFAILLRDGRRHYPRAESLPAATERALVGGIASIVCGHLLMEDPQAIPSLETQLVELVLIPYLGEHEARRTATS